MKTYNLPFLYLILFLMSISTIYAQYTPREDAIWARTTTEEIVLDGVLDESSWARAEELKIIYGSEYALLPWTMWSTDPNGGSGNPVDSVDASVKFLVKGNDLYLAFDANDLSVYGSTGWANWDGLLMSLKSRKTDDYLNGGVSSPTEYFYTYWYSGADVTFGFPGCPPIFRGTFENAFLDTVSHNPDLFDGYWKVDGVANDTLPDVGWIAEIKINLDTLGIDVTQPGGDIVEMNFSIWDKDDFGDPLTAYTCVAGWQTRWNNNDNPGRIHASPDVTIDTEILPEIAPDFILPNGAQQPEMVIDGVLDEDIWTGAYSFDLGWDSAIREGYSNIGPYRSGRFQPELDLDGDGTLDPRAAVVDGAFANIKMFFKDNYLYLAADVNDKVIQGVDVTESNLFDGVEFRFMHRIEMQPENMPQPRHYSIYWGSDGEVGLLDNLIEAVDTGSAEIGVTLKGESIVNDQSALDEGYIVEMKLDMTKLLGYSEDLGDKLIFGGVLLRDGDLLDDDPLSSYGNRAWWYGERANWAFAWGVLDPEMVVGVEDNVALVPNEVEIYGNYPNPFNPETTIKFAIPTSGTVQLNVYNVLGQSVKEISVEDLVAGTHELNFDASNFASGVYFYQLSLSSNLNDNNMMSKTNKMILMK